MSAPLMAPANSHTDQDRDDRRQVREVGINDFAPRRG